MTMHLAHPALTTTGRRRGRKKFRTSAQAQSARELRSSWQALLERNQVDSNRKRLAARPLGQSGYRLAPPPGRATTSHIPSLNEGRDTDIARRAEDKRYTGNVVIGIATMHKSNAVPVLAPEDAKEIARMRRG